MSLQNFVEKVILGTKEISLTQVQFEKMLGSLKGTKSMEF
jgi:hypothetical protein